MLKNAAAAGDGRFGSTRERGNDGRRTANGDNDTATATKWVGFPPDFFPSSNRLFRFPSDLEIVPIFLLFIEIFVYVVFTGLRFLLGESLYFPCQFDFLVQCLFGSWV